MSVHDPVDDEAQGHGAQGHSLIDELVDDFTRRQQAGESPSVSDYCQDYPELADEIRELLPMLSMLEDLKSDSKEQNEKEQPGPAVVGGYRILRELGHGGMGVVYEAEHESLGRRVALKILPRRLSNDSRALARFEREARAIASIHHTNVVPLFEFGQDDGLFFLAMQLIEGQSLDEIIAAAQPDLLVTDLNFGQATAPCREVGSCHQAESGQSFEASNSTRGSSLPAPNAHPEQESFRRVAHIGIQLADALAYAHRRGVIHRDVKPSNILVDENHVVWLTDFGLAKTDEEDLTQTGDFLGTLRYMAPERLRGVCDHRSDVYSLGLTLYELLTLRPVFSATDRLAIIHAIENQTPPLLRSVNPQIPGDLETIVTKAMHKDLSQRYRSAQELSDDLQRFLADQPIRARRQTSLDHFNRWRRRNRGLARAISASAVLLLLLLVGSSFAAIRESALRRQAEIAIELADQRQFDLRRTLYFAEMNLAGQAASANGGLEQVAEITDRWHTSPDQIEFRGWEWFFLRSLCDSDVITIGPLLDVPDVFECRWSPDDKLVAIAQGNGELTIWDAETGELTSSLSGHEGGCVCVDWHPDGRWLASGGLHGDVRIWVPGSGELIRDIKQGTSRVHAIRWNASGSSLAWGAGSQLFVCDNDPESTPASLEHINTVINVIQWSPDGTYLVGGNSWQNQCTVWSVDDRSMIQKLTANAVRWDQDGHGIAGWVSTNPDGEMNYWDAKTNLRRERLLGHTAYVSGLQWSRDSQFLFSASFDETIRVWDIDTGLATNVLRGHTDEVRHIDVSHDGKCLVTSSRDGTVKIWKIQDNICGVLEGHDGIVRDVSWHPDGIHLATVGHDSTVRIASVTDRKNVAVLRFSSAAVETVAWSPDGSHLAFGATDGVISIVETKQYSLLRAFKAHESFVHDVEWSPDGRHLASTGFDKTVRLWDPFTDHDSIVVGRFVTTGHCVQWHPSGGMLAAGSQDGRILIWDTESRKLLTECKGDSGHIIAIDWSPDGRQFATASRDGTIDVWDLASREHRFVLRGHHGPVWDVSWHPDGSRLATCSRDGTVKLWDPDSGSETLTLQPSHRPPTEFWCIQWDRRGQKLAAGTARGSVSIWDANRGYVAEGGMDFDVVGSKNWNEHSGQ